MADGFTPYSIDDSVKSKASEMIGVSVPDGDYLLEIASCVASAIDKPAAYSWRFRILEGAGGVGQLITYYCSMKDSNELLGKKSTFFGLGNLISSALSNEAAEKFQEALAPVDGKPRIAIKTYDDHVKLGAKLEEKLKGLKVYGLVAGTEANGRMFSNVVRVGPASMFAGPGPAAPATNGAPKSPATPANSVTAGVELQSSVDSVFSGRATI